MKKGIYDWINELIFPIVAPVIFEVGASTGTDTVRLAAIRNSLLHVFEPDPRCKFANMPSNVTVNKKAVSNENGTAEFIQSDTKQNLNIYSGSLLEPKNHLTTHKHVAFDNRIQVDTVTLDSYCHRNNIESIDFIYMDVQGAESKVFEGAENILKKTKYIYTEYSDFEMYDGQKPLLDLLKQLKTFIVLDIWSKEPSNVLLMNTAL